MVPFGFSNAPAIFMCLMNSVFREYLDKFVIALLDGILIYSKLEEENEHHLRMCSRKYQDYPPRRDIDFSINFMPGAVPISKTPYRMSTP